LLSVSHRDVTKSPRDYRRHFTDMILRSDDLIGAITAIFLSLSLIIDVMAIADISPIAN